MPDMADSQIGSAVQIGEEQILMGVFTFSPTPICLGICLVLFFYQALVLTAQQKSSIIKIYPRHPNI